ncbi:6-hydroxymethylpterin diphosphokinase MptE-like protein [Gynuella sp.]|uniref:6-hydroxymethylpterin diphosphokinase MptE-like protein n=1 Tax=Gynuella sp. TaxID=2969146 RepID=UPI003D0E68B1
MNSRLASLKNRHVDERCVLVCNGPSLNNMNLSFLKREYCIGLNKIYLGFNKFRFYPQYYVAINSHVLRQSEHEIKKLTSRKFLSAKASDIFKENSLTHLINTGLPPSIFSTDIAYGIGEGWTVTYAALQIAYHLGFKEIIIIGMDHRFQFEGRANETNRMLGKDCNHFCDTYFSGQKWDNPDLDNSEKSYKHAKEIFEKDNRVIYDATVDGACNVFKKINYKEYFGI